MYNIHYIEHNGYYHYNMPQCLGNYNSHTVHIYIYIIYMYIPNQRRQNTLLTVTDQILVQQQATSI